MRATTSGHFATRWLVLLAGPLSILQPVLQAQSSGASLMVSAIVVSRCAIESPRTETPSPAERTAWLRCSGRPARAVTARIENGPAARVTVLGPNDVRIHVPRVGRDAVLSIEF